MRPTNLWPRPRSRSHQLAVIRLGLLMGALALSPTCASASPSKFVYAICDSGLPGGGAPAVQLEAQTEIFAFDTCAAPGGSFGLDSSPSPGRGLSQLKVSVPATPGGYVETEAISAGSAGIAQESLGFVREQGWPPSGAGEWQRIFHLRSEAPPPSGDASGDFSIVYICNGPGHECKFGFRVYAHYVAATEVDPNPPTTSLGGSMLTGGIRRGKQTLSYAASDEGGGVSEVEILINGSLASRIPTNCSLTRIHNPSYEGMAAESPTPCPATVADTKILDTAASPFVTGANSVQVCARDLSVLTEGNRGCSTPATVTVDDSCPESQAGTGTKIAAHFKGTRADSLTVPHGTPAQIVGEVQTADGSPVPGATVCVKSQILGAPAPPAPLDSTVADGSGQFIYPVPPGPNREVELGYRRDDFQTGQTLHYFAHAKPTIHLSRARLRAGGAIQISGSLPGGFGEERVVVLQASALHSRRWFTFRRATTNRLGSYRSSYRFDATTRSTTYRIRTLVPPQSGYPWEVGKSKPAKVRVHAGDRAASS
jgi:hypothetical protein